MTHSARAMSPSPISLSALLLSASLPVHAAVVPFERGKPIVAVVYPGQKPDSMFGGNGNSGDAPDAAAVRLKQTPLGVKWFRGNGLNSDSFAKQHGFNQLMIALLLSSYNNQNHPEQAIDATNMFSALKPEFVDKAIASQIDVLKQHPDIKAVEFYNEQWWMYQAAPMSRYREDSKKFYQAVKAYDPSIIVLNGNTASAVQDDIAIDGGEQWSDGFAPHSYAGTGALTFYNEPFWRYLDWGRQQTEKYHKKYQWMTEGGDMRSAPANYPTMAFKMLQRHATHPFVGIQKTFEFMQDEFWSSPPMYDAYKIMTTLLEDKKPIKELWPASMMMWGSLFAENGQSVAVIWNLSGKDPLKADAGEISVPHANKLAAFDVFGKPIGAYNPALQTLKVPIGNAPAYLVGDISAIDMDHLIEGAQIHVGQPVQAMVEPLAGPVGGATPLCVRLYNGDVQTARGTIDATVPGWRTQPGVPFAVEPGKFAVVTVPVLSAADNKSNVYTVALKVTAKGSAEPYLLTQAVQAAFMPQNTPTIDGKLDDWKSAVPVSMATYEQGLDATFLALNPTAVESDDGGQARGLKYPSYRNTLIHFYSAYDKDNLYLAYKLTGKLRAFSLFQESDIDFGTLALRLRNDGDPLSVAIRDSLPTAARALLDTYGEGKTFPEDLKPALLEKLNALLQQDDLYSPERVAGRSLAPAVQQQLATLHATEPHGLDLIRLNRLMLENAYPAIAKSGEWVQVGLGLTDWSPRNVRRPSDPWAYKGYFNDTDYLFALNDPGGQLWCLSSPQAEFRTPYNWMIANKGGGPEKNLRFVSDLDYQNRHFTDLVAGGSARLAVRDEGGIQTVECAISRRLIPEFHPENGKPIRLSFILHDSPDVEISHNYEWSKAAGDFSFLRGHGSFVPSWEMLYPNQLQWGVQGPPPRQQDNVN